MTTSFDAERYQRALERWRALAEQRLEHMTVLYESGRWRRYFSEEQFIGVIRETRTAVNEWRRIVPEHETIAALFATLAETQVVRSQPRPEPFAAPAAASFAAPLPEPRAAPIPEPLAVAPLPEPFATPPSAFTTPLPELQLSLG